MMNMPRVQKSIGTVRFVEDVMTKSFERDTVNLKKSPPHLTHQTRSLLDFTSHDVHMWRYRNFQSRRVALREYPSHRAESI